MTGILLSTGIAILLGIPFLWIHKSEKRLTWTQAIIVGSVLSSIGLILIADVPSRILYLFDQENANWAARGGIFKILLGGERAYKATRDVVANTVQGIFFVVLMALAYFWGKARRKAGRFKS